MSRLFRIALLLALLCGPALAAENSSRWAVGAGSSGLSLRYGFDPELAAEGRVVYYQGVKTFGQRLYYNVNPGARAVFYLGGGHDFVSFDIPGIKGRGNAYGYFGGVEVAISDGWSAAVDLGNTRIHLRDSASRTADTGNEVILNATVYWTFGRTRSDTAAAR